ncbi:MAG: hypothetical protein KC472_11960 [Dehalococcoidia bacterium]|nr:hypothetical protein [Dehalococcoidia bacterium]
MSRDDSSVVRRAFRNLRVGLGFRAGPDPLDDVEVAAHEVRQRLAHLSREMNATPRLLRTRPAERRV